MNPQIGEIRKGKEIGKKGGSSTSYFIWAKCLDCDKERWVICLNSKPRNQRCKSCGGKLASLFLIRRYGTENPAWKGGRVKLGDYIGIRQPNHLSSNRKGYVLEHILIWERIHNKPLPKGWVIHHLNGIKDDNRPRNLLALPRKGHHTELVNQALKLRIRELEQEVKLLEKALTDNQAIFRIEEN